jgi:hypothetical protein
VFGRRKTKQKRKLTEGEFFKGPAGRLGPEEVDENTLDEDPDRVYDQELPADTVLGVQTNRVDVGAEELEVIRR